MFGSIFGEDCKNYNDKEINYISVDVYHSNNDFYFERKVNNESEVEAIKQYIKEGIKESKILEFYDCFREVNILVNTANVLYIEISDIVMSN